MLSAKFSGTRRAQYQYHIKFLSLYLLNPVVIIRRTLTYKNMSGIQTLELGSVVTQLHWGTKSLAGFFL